MTGSTPPGPRDKIPGSSLFAFRRDRTGFLTQLAHDYGDIACFSVGRRKLCLLNHPSYIQDVLTTYNSNFVKSRALERARLVLGEGLLTSEGDFHLRQRRMIQPAFHRERIAAYGSVMTEYAMRASERWRDGEDLNLSHEMMRLTLAIVAQTLFSADVENEADEIGRSITDSLGMFDLLTLPFSTLLMAIPLPAVRRIEKARSRLDKVIYGLIDERRARGEDTGDVLSMLLRTQEIEGDKHAMTDAQVRDETLTLIAAGHETTAVALTWTWYLLSQNPEAEAKLHHELDSTLGGRAPSVKYLPNLPYTRMVITESMRLFPPAWAIGRRALQDCEIGGYTLPGGSVVLVSQFVTHRDPRFYPEPLKFVPERWTPDRRAEIPRFAYFPFGAGNRACIGESFAWTEATLLLATMAQRWRLQMVPGQTVGLRPLITLRPKHPMMMTTQKR